MSAVLLVLGCVIAPVGLTANWARTLVTDQDAYLAAVAPLSGDPVIIGAARTALVDGIESAVAGLRLTERASEQLQGLGLPPLVASLVSAGVASWGGSAAGDAIERGVDRVLSSEQLSTIWLQANRTAHSAFVEVMRGGNPVPLHGLSVDLRAAVSQVKQRLESAGATWAAQIPDVPVVLDIAGNPDVQRLAGYYRALEIWGVVLPILAAVALLLSILTAGRRLAALGRAALGVIVSMIVLTVLLAIGRDWLTGQVSVHPEVTRAFADRVTMDLRVTIRTVVVLAAVLAALSVVFGDSPSAVGAREWFRRVTGAGADGTGWQILRVAAAMAAALLVGVLVWATPAAGWAVVVGVTAVLAGAVATGWPGGRAGSAGAGRVALVDDGPPT